MRKLIVLLMISFVVFSCSHKTTPSATNVKAEVKAREESATVSNAQFVEGKALSLTYCTKCHAEKNPSRGNMTQWDKWLDKMAPKAKITDEQKMKIRDYISVNAKSI
jgi:cytochrome c5